MLVEPMFSYLVVRVTAHPPLVTFTACRLPPLLSGKGWAAWVSLSFMLVFEFVILSEQVLEHALH